MEYPAWFIPVIAVAVVANFGFSWWCCWKAKKAYKAAEELWEWVKAVHDPLVCLVELNPECKPGAGGWPPKKLGDFPP